ncbi:MAG: hypothetical protein IE909_09395 [Campylobacterales bacterium]|nr:hypothetical protein [Campylobacterales bacterium]
MSEIINVVIEYMDKATIVFAFITMIGVLYNIKQNKKQLDKIPIYFNEKKLNLDIARKDFSRQEIQGILGLFRKDMKIHYDIKYLSKIDYLDSIYKIQVGKEDSLKIELTKNELEQFKDDIYKTNI